MPVADIALSITDWVRNLVPRLLFRYRAYLIVPNGATPLLLDEWWCVPNLGQEPNFPCSALAHIYRSPMAVGVCAAVSAQASYMELAPSYYCVAPKRRNFIERGLSTQGAHFELVLIKLLDGLRSQCDSRGRH